MWTTNLNKTRSQWTYHSSGAPCIRLLKILWPVLLVTFKSGYFIIIIWTSQDTNHKHIHTFTWEDEDRWSESTIVQLSKWSALSPQSYILSLPHLLSLLSVFYADSTKNTPVFTETTHIPGFPWQPQVQTEQEEDYQCHLRCLGAFCWETVSESVKKLWFRKTHLRIWVDILHVWSLFMVCSDETNVTISHALTTIRVKPGGRAAIFKPVHLTVFVQFDLWPWRLVTVQHVLLLNIKLRKHSYDSYLYPTVTVSKVFSLWYITYREETSAHSIRHSQY